jgi:hypothetical protein
MVFVCDRRAGFPGGFFAAGMPQLLTFCGRNAATPYFLRQECRCSYLVASNTIVSKLLNSAGNDLK